MKAWIIAAVLLLAAVPDVRKVQAVRKDNPVIIATFKTSDWSSIYTIDLPVAGVYDLRFSCGLNEDAETKGLVGPGQVRLEIRTVLREEGECYLSTYDRHPIEAADGGSDAGL